MHKRQMKHLQIPYSIYVPTTIDKHMITFSTFPGCGRGIGTVTGAQIRWVGFGASISASPWTPKALGKTSLQKVLKVEVLTTGLRACILGADLSAGVHVLWTDPGACLVVSGRGTYLDLGGAWEYVPWSRHGDRCTHCGPRSLRPFLQRRQRRQRQQWRRILDLLDARVLQAKESAVGTALWPREHQYNLPRSWPESLECLNATKRQLFFH